MYLYIYNVYMYTMYICNVFYCRLLSPLSPNLLLKCNVGGVYIHISSNGKRSLSYNQNMLNIIFVIGKSVFIVYVFKINTV